MCPKEAGLVPRVLGSVNLRETTVQATLSLHVSAVAKSVIFAATHPPLSRRATAPGCLEVHFLFAFFADFARATGFALFCASQGPSRVQ